MHEHYLPSPYALLIDRLQCMPACPQNVCGRLLNSQLPPTNPIPPFDRVYLMQVIYLLPFLTTTFGTPFASRAHHPRVLRVFTCDTTFFPDDPTGYAPTTTTTQSLKKYMSVKDAIMSLIDGKIRHEYDRPKVTSARPFAVHACHTLCIGDGISWMRHTGSTPLWFRHSAAWVGFILRPSSTAIKSPAYSTYGDISVFASLFFIYIRQ